VGRGGRCPTVIFGARARDLAHRLSLEAEAAHFRERTIRGESPVRGRVCRQSRHATWPRKPRRPDNRVPLAAGQQDGQLQVRLTTRSSDCVEAQSIRKHANMDDPVLVNENEQRSRRFGACLAHVSRGFVSLRESRQHERRTSTIRHRSVDGGLSQTRQGEHLRAARARSCRRLWSGASRRADTSQREL